MNSRIPKFTGEQPVEVHERVYPKRHKANAFYARALRRSDFTLKSTPDQAVSLSDFSGQRVMHWHFTRLIGVRYVATRWRFIMKSCLNFKELGARIAWHFRRWCLVPRGIRSRPQAALPLAVRL